MPRTLAPPLPARHRMSLDAVHPQMAKANVIELDNAWMRAVGRAIDRAVSLVGWSHKEAAAKVGTDEAEFSRWLSGTRRAQFDRLFAVTELREPLVICLAALSTEAEVTTTIHFRRQA